MRKGRGHAVAASAHVVAPEVELEERGRADSLLDVVPGAEDPHGPERRRKLEAGEDEASQVERRPRGAPLLQPDGEVQQRDDGAEGQGVSIDVERRLERGPARRAIRRGDIGVVVNPGSRREREEPSRRRLVRAPGVHRVE